MIQELIEIIIRDNDYEYKFLMTKEEWDKDGLKKILYIALFGTKDEKGSAARNHT